MHDPHVELTAEVRQILDVFAETRYNNKEHHPVVSMTIQRLRRAVEQHGKTQLLIERRNVSEELREALYDREVRPILEKIEQMAIRYSMPVQILLEWGDDGQCAVFTHHADRVPCAMLQMVMLLVSTRGNIDAFVQKVGALARAVGHDSTVLDAIGIPRTPPDDIKQAMEDQGI